MIDFFYNNYPTVKEKFSYQDCVNLFNKFSSFYIPNKFVALYLNVDDGIFDLIRNFPYFLEEKEFIEKCFINKGKNTHFFYCVGNGLNNILECIKEVSRKENSKTISWYRDDMKKLHIRRMLCPSH